MRVCVTGAETSVWKLRERIEQVLYTHPKLLCELRLDYLQLSPSELFRFLATLPEDWTERMILTNRLAAFHPSARGECNWDLPTWQSWWLQVLQFRPWYAVDLDWIVLDRLTGESISWKFPEKFTNLFFSYHGTLDAVEKVFADLLGSAQSYGAGIKIAAPVFDANDLYKLTNIAEKIENVPFKIIVAMEEAGRAWRWSKLSGDISYFAINQMERTAPGQANWQEILPYLDHLDDLQLYVLWSQDANNVYGEKRWNSVFQARGLNARYFNIACKPENFSAKNALQWMEKASIQGASITRPFKEQFATELSLPDKAINTLKKVEAWHGMNSDGLAIIKILNDYNLENRFVTIIGGGGAGQAVGQTLQKQGFSYFLWRRSGNGHLTAHPDLDKTQVLINTWPVEFQDRLVQNLEEFYVGKKNLELIIDSQLVEEEKLPLARWSKEMGIPYISGKVWWKWQAQKQAEYWQLSEGLLADKIFSFIPSSKSETIRSLAIAALLPGTTVIRNPALCRDTEVFQIALRQLGIKIIEENEYLWEVQSEGILRAPERAIFLDEGAAGFRFLYALANVMEGEYLILDAAPGLRKRIKAEHWPIKIAITKKIENEISFMESSQFASGCLIAAAIKAYQENRSQTLLLKGEKKSFSYFLLTKIMLEKFGFEILLQEDKVCIQNWPKKNVKFDILIAQDASALPYPQLLLQYWGLTDLYQKYNKNIFTKNSGQGDFIFPELFHDLGKPISLKNFPDLAPALWVAAILCKKALTIIDTPQLRIKESDRIDGLVKASQVLGFTAEARADGFFVDAINRKPPLTSLWREPILLHTEGDHRLAMAFGVLQTIWPHIVVDNKNCVVKSFPHFWELLNYMQELMP